MISFTTPRTRHGPRYSSSLYEGNSLLDEAVEWSQTGNRGKRAGIQVEETGVVGGGARSGRTGWRRNKVIRITVERSKNKQDKEENR